MIRMGQLPLGDLQHPQLYGLTIEHAAILCMSCCRHKKNQYDFAADRFHFLATATLSNSPVKRISSELDPTMTRKTPGSSTKCILRSHNDRSDGVSVKLTVFFSPGCSEIRSKPRRFFSYVVTLLTISRV